MSHWRSCLSLKFLWSFEGNDFRNQRWTGKKSLVLFVLVIYKHVQVSLTTHLLRIVQEEALSKLLSDESLTLCDIIWFFNNLATVLTARMLGGEGLLLTCTFLIIVLIWEELKLCKFCKGRTFPGVILIHWVLVQQWFRLSWHLKALSTFYICNIQKYT